MATYYARTVLVNKGENGFNNYQVDVGYKEGLSLDIPVRNSSATMTYRVKVEFIQNGRPHKHKYYHMKDFPVRYQQGRTKYNISKPRISGKYHTVALKARFGHEHAPGDGLTFRLTAEEREIKKK